MPVEKYEPLKKVFYRATSGGRELVAEQLRVRRSSPAAFTWPYEVGKHGVFYVHTRGLAERVERVWRQEIQIAALWQKLPVTAREHYFHELVVDEIKATNDIENISSTRKEVAAAVEAERSMGKASEGAPVRRFREMVRQYLALPGEFLGRDDLPPLGFPSNLSEIRSLYDSLVGEEVDKADVPDGELFRTGDVSLNDGVRELHAGARGESAIRARLEVMLDSVHESRGVQLFAAFVEHFMFEHTHPFYDGNGRMGRFLLSIRLSRLLSTPTALSLSAEIFRQKRRYYDAFTTAEDPMNYGELTFFVEDMAAMVNAAQARLLSSLEERSDRLNRLEQSLRALESEGAASELALSIAFLLGQVALFGPRAGLSLDEVAGVVGVSKPTARKGITDLESMGYVEFLSRRPLVTALTTSGLTWLGLAE